jgi:hypothetical protein
MENLRDFWIDDPGAASRKTITILIPTPILGPFVSVTVEIYEAFPVRISERAKRTA